MKVGIFSKTDERSLQVARALAELAKKYGLGIEAEKSVAGWLGLEGKPLAEMEADIMICIGGDGTVLTSIRHNPAPVLGINTSIVGFLCELDGEEIEAAVERLAGGRYTIEARTRISTVLDSRKLPDALNDVVVRADVKSNVIWLRVSLDGEDVEEVRGDGLIVSTPSGSTGYARSAGGPVLDPGLDAFVIVPIAPFSRALPPLVVPGSSVIGIEVLGRSGHVVIDGRKEADVSGGMRLVCRKSEVPGKFVRLEGKFYRKVREKLS